MRKFPEYQILLSLMARLIESQSGTPIEPGQGWVNDAQALSVKLFEHLSSIQTLSRGTNFEQDSKVLFGSIDHASIKVLARAAFETYLVFYYIFVGGVTPDARYRHNTWMLAGLMDRQKSFAANDEHKAQLKTEFQQVEQLRKAISKDEIFQCLTKKQQEQILGGNWRVGQAWRDLGVNAGFHEKYFQDIYSYLCGYSHSSYISVLQCSQARYIEDQHMLAASIVDIGTVIMAHFCHTYSSLFPAAQAELKRNPAGMKAV